MTENRSEALASRILDGLTVGSEMLTLELGRRLGLYDALAQAGPLTSEALADRTVLNERYAREWLEQQAAAGFLEYEGGEYSLPPDYVAVLVDPVHPLYSLGMTQFLAGVAATLPEVERAYRAGTGVRFEQFGPDVREGIAGMNRPGFENDMREWVDALPDIAARLDDGGVILDAGCGTGWSTIALARAFPRARVVGVDLDAASVAQARLNAVSEDVGFIDGDVSDLAEADGFTLVTVFEALHDMGEPIRALAAFRRVLTQGGAVLVADERVADRYEPPTGVEERMQYAASVLHCLPATLAESATVANGTVLRAPTVLRWGAEAGFENVEELPVEHPLWRFYRLSGATIGE